MNEKFNERISKFATAVGKTPEEIINSLKPIIGEPNDEALELLDNKEAVPDTDIKAAFVSLSIPSGKLNLHIGKLREEKPAPVEEAASKASGIGSLSILPTLPDETSFLEMLKTGGVLKVETTEVIAAIKASIAKTLGIFELPEKIGEKMEAHSIAQDEPCGEEFYKIQKLITSNKYGDVLSAVGISGSYISEKRKKEFFVKIDERLWPALRMFHSQLNEWTNTWTNGMSNPGMLMLAMTANQSGAALPPGMMTPPDTLPLRTAGEEVVNEINRVFAGSGIPVARALAYDATRIMGILENKDLPAQVGSTNKDQMLKELGISVGAGIVQLEQSITRYALAIMSIPKVTADNELPYFSAMVQLGSSIPWDKLGSKGLGGKDLRN